MRTVHVVEDDDAVRASLQALIAIDANATVHTYASGDEFLERAATLAPGVVLLDQHMPGSSGLAVLRALAARPSMFAVAVLTGNADVALAVDAMKAGAFDFLLKPFSAARLRACIDAGWQSIEARRPAAMAVEQAEARIKGLTPRERAVLCALIADNSNKGVARELGLSPRTVEIHRANMMAKLGAGSLSAALRIAFTAGLG